MHRFHFRLSSMYHFPYILPFSHCLDTITSHILAFANDSSTRAMTTSLKVAADHAKYCFRRNDKLSEVPSLFWVEGKHNRSQLCFHVVGLSHAQSPLLPDYMLFRNFISDRFPNSPRAWTASRDDILRRSTAN
jgi:hypothetical protein